jgi:hypothetical protein
VAVVVVGAGVVVAAGVVSAGVSQEMRVADSVRSAISRAKIFFIIVNPFV